VFVLRSSGVGALVLLSTTLVACSVLTSLNGLSGGTGGGGHDDGSPIDGSGAVPSTIADAASDPDAPATTMNGADGASAGDDASATEDAGAADDASAADSGKETTDGAADAAGDAAHDGASPADSGHVDACVPTALVCDGKVHKCDGVVDEGCPSAITIGAPGSDQVCGGTSGGNSFSDACPAGQVLVGIGGATGQWIDAVYGICGVVDLKASTSSDPYTYTVTIGPGTTLPTEGMIGGSDTLWQAQCPANTAVVEVAGNSGEAMDQVDLSCAPLVITGSPGSFALHQGTVTAIAPEGDTGGGGPFTPVVCPDPQVMALVWGGAGVWVDNMGVACAAPELSLVH
jgi:hypothetical protein